MEHLRDHALNLAVFRIVVGCVILWIPDLHHAPDYAALPPNVLTAPVGLDVTLVSPTLTRLLHPVALVAVVAGVLGFWTRSAWTVATLALLYVLGVPQFVGSAFHYHHLVWFAALLAVSPSGDALSVDAWRANRRGESLDRGRSIAYGIPIRTAWVLLGIVFFFPGVHKLAEAGLDWVFSDNLRNQLYAKWMQRPGFEPLFRIDHYPVLLQLGAASVIALELSFGALVMFRRTRWLAVLGALLFHQLTAYFMGLHFEALYLTYVVFFDLDRGVRRLRGAPPAETEKDETLRASRPALVVAAVLIAGNLVFGALGISDGWPFACYPKFHRALRHTDLPALELEAVYADGSSAPIPVTAMSPEGPVPRWWALTWSLLGAHERATADPARFEAFYRQVAPRRAVAEITDGAVAIRFYRARVSTIPEEHRRTLSRRLVHQMTLGDGDRRVERP